MINLINEINSKLKAIISELETKKSECEKVLDEVKSKIDKKIDEAKGYKVDVDNAKEKIKSLEEEIKALEVDLTDLNERFGKKDLNAIVEAGNKEINAKMIAKQNEITKYREKIGELTEKARAIKDLLINLKKDKEIKTDKLDAIYHRSNKGGGYWESYKNLENLIMQATIDYLYHSAEDGYSIDSIKGDTDNCTEEKSCYGVYTVGEILDKNIYYTNEKDIEGSISYLKGKEKELLLLLIEKYKREFTPIEVSKELNVTNKTVINRLAVLSKNGFVVPILVNQRIKTFRANYC